MLLSCHPYLAAACREVALGSACTLFSCIMAQRLQNLAAACISFPGGPTDFAVDELAAEDRIGLLVSDGHLSAIVK